MNIENPILPGFHPDPSICRVGNDYYIVNSTFEWFPGVPIHHSNDLMNWRLIGHALTRKSQLDLRGVPDSAGVWAPSLSYADGRFWLVYTNVRNTGRGRPFKDLDIFLTTAPEMIGPWSEPIELNSIGFDPSLFNDDDGRKWLVNMIWDFRRDHYRFGGIVIQEYDHRQRKMVGPMAKILEKPGVLIEGPNLYKRHGWYYLMLAEGGTGWNHGISMARSKNILGPYQLDPRESVLTSRDDPALPLQKAGHGELVETPAGEWYLVHLASRPLLTGYPPDPRSPDKTAAAQARAGHRCVLGRETCLQRVEWTNDGWLRIAGGGHHPRVSWPAPGGLPPHPWPGIPERDHFDSFNLAAEWSSLRVPVDESWLSLAERPGWLRLRGRDSLHSWFDQSLIARRVQHCQFTAETCLEFSPAHFNQSAGLICWYDTRTHFYLRTTRDEVRGRILGIVLTDDGSYDELAESEIAVNEWRQLFLRAGIDFAKLQFSASPDGKNWRNLGPVLDASRLSDDYGAGLHFTGAMVGLCAQDVGGDRTHADFDYFDYRPT
ncbi:MAG TPA: glycoside hydrolase family 43 protein [Verrucomicrobiae bacterium]|nr:glycoside hydrolase family 43 protein [Verrucomicrobiae bacterium]